MGGAIVVSLANQNKTLPIEGVVLVAPAIGTLLKIFLKVKS